MDVPGRATVSRAARPYPRLRVARGRYCRRTEHLRFFLTLILTANYAHCLLHVSDRLTSLSGTGREWEGSANKSIVVRTNDGLAFVGYSGDAYVGDVPTDTWLAGALYDAPAIGDEALARGRGGLRGVGIDAAAMRIERALRSTQTGLLIVHVAGYRRRSRDSRFTAIALRFEAQGRDLRRISRSVNREQRWAGPTASGIGPIPIVSACPGLTGPQFRELMDRLGAHRQSLEDFEQVLVDFVREYPSPTVGDHLMSLRVDRLDDGRITTRFLPATNDDYPRQEFMGSRMALGYTPWLLSPWGYLPPREIGGGELGLQGESFFFDVQGLPPLDGDALYMGGVLRHRRRKRPGRAALWPPSRRPDDPGTYYPPGA
jgi:hypothetical protein